MGVLELIYVLVYMDSRFECATMNYLEMCMEKSMIFAIFINCWASRKVVQGVF